MINVAILGAGNIAGKMAQTLRGMIEQGGESVARYAIASRNSERALQFAENYGFEKAYGSYEEMLRDPDVDLVYVATPHSHHYEHMKLCLQHGKHVLCEKPFTVNARQAEEITSIARIKRLYAAEAIWTRYLPSRRMIDELIAGGAIGTPKLLTANLAYVLDQVERMQKPELAGGALLDLGVYVVNFTCMVFGGDIVDVQATGQMTDTGVDVQDAFTFTYADSKMAVLCTAMNCVGDTRGVVYGTKGTLSIDTLLNPQVITVTPIQEAEQACSYHVPKQITGFEYELQAAVNAIENGNTECEAMPHAETIRMMRIMDDIRGRIGLIYPFE